MNSIKRVILCADDYGQNESVSQAIVHLVKAGRLSAVSCLVTGADWPLHWETLKPLRSQIDVGLHFNLTEGVPLSDTLKARGGFQPVGRLLLSAMMGRLDPAVMAAELVAQLDRFRAVTGEWPDFIDGHQHVQHFRGVREAVAGEYLRRLARAGCYIRCIDEPSLWSLAQGPARFKRLVLRLSGTRAFRQLLEERHIPHNPSFSGIYPFAQASRYGQLFPKFLEQIRDGGLILCHPGQAEADPLDPIARTRAEEYQFLQGADFLKICKEAGVVLGRFDVPSVQKLW